MAYAMIIDTRETSKDFAKNFRKNKSELEMLRKLIDEGENSGRACNWDVNKFLKNTKKKNPKHTKCRQIIES